MAVIGTLTTFTTGSNLVADLNTNFSNIRTAFNDTAVLTDTARTITVTHESTALQKITIGGGFTPYATPVGLQVTVLQSASSGSFVATVSEARQSAATTGGPQGVEGFAQVTHTSGTVVLAIATVGNVAASGVGGTLTWARSVQGGGDLQGGTVTSAASLYAGNYGNTTGTGTIGTAYGVYVESISRGSTNYAIYCAGTTQSYFGGAVAINSGGLTVTAGGATITAGGLAVTAGALTTADPSAGFGYASGAGGTVSQGTDKSTSVTLNKRTGQITMHNASLNDATNVTFTVANTTVLAGDTVSLTHISGGTLGAYQFTPHSISAATSFKITVRNVSGGSLGEAPVIQFNLIRGASA